MGFVAPLFVLLVRGDAHHFALETCVLMTCVVAPVLGIPSIVVCMLAVGGAPVYASHWCVDRPRAFAAYSVMSYLGGLALQWSTGHAFVEYVVASILLLAHANTYAQLIAPHVRSKLDVAMLTTSAACTASAVAMLALGVDLWPLLVALSLALAYVLCPADCRMEAERVPAAHMPSDAIALPPASDESMATEANTSGSEGEEDDDVLRTTNADRELIV